MQIHIPHLGHTVYLREILKLEPALEGASMTTSHSSGERKTTVSLIKGKPINLPCLVHEFVHVSQLIFDEYHISHEEKEHQAYIVQFLLNEWLIAKDISPVLQV